MPSWSIFGSHHKNCDLLLLAIFYIPCSVNPRLINPKWLFNWEGTIETYQIMTVGGVPPLINKQWLLILCWHYIPTHTHLGISKSLSLPYTKQAPPCYDMLQPCFLFVPKERHPGGISKAMKVQFCRTLPSFSGLPRLTTVMSWTAQLSLVASVRTAEGGISYRRILDM